MYGTTASFNPNCKDYRLSKDYMSPPLSHANSSKYTTVNYNTDKSINLDKHAEHNTPLNTNNSNCSEPVKKSKCVIF